MADRQKKVLFTCHPFGAHVYPHNPLKNMFKAQGWDVKLQTADKMAKTARQYGFEWVNGGRDWTADPAVRGGVARELLENGNDAFCEAAFTHLAQAARYMAPDVLEYAKEYKPDLIVTDIAEFGGYLAAKKLGIPVITSDNGLARLVHDLWVPTMRPIVNEVADSLGIEPETGDVPGSFQTMLTPAPKELLLPDLALPGLVSFQKVHPQRQGSGRLPDGAFESDNPKVYAMFGSTGSTVPEWGPIFEGSNTKTIEALADKNYDVLLPVGKGNVSKYADFDGPEEALGMRAVPANGAPNVKVVAFCDQPYALKLADFAMLHGGFGGITESQVVDQADPEPGKATPALWMPNQTDQPANAKMLAEGGFGLHLEPRSATTADVAAKFDELVARKAEWDANLARLQVRNAQMPSLSLVGERIGQAIEVGDLNFSTLKEPPAGPGSGALGESGPTGPIVITGPGGGAPDPRAHTEQGASDDGAAETEDGTTEPGTNGGSSGTENASESAGTEDGGTTESGTNGGSSGTENASETAATDDAGTESQIADTSDSKAGTGETGTSETGTAGASASDAATAETGAADTAGSGAGEARTAETEAAAGAATSSEETSSETDASATADAGTTAETSTEAAPAESVASPGQEPGEAAITEPGDPVGGPDPVTQEAVENAEPSESYRTDGPAERTRSPESTPETTPESEPTPLDAAAPETPATTEPELAPAPLNTLALSEDESPEAPVVQNPPGAEPTEGEAADWEPAKTEPPQVVVQAAYERVVETNGHRDLSNLAEGPSGGPEADAPTGGRAAPPAPGEHDEDDEGPAAPASEPDPSDGPISTDPGGGGAPEPERFEDVPDDESAWVNEPSEHRALETPGEDEVDDAWSVLEFSPPQRGHVEAIDIGWDTDGVPVSAPADKPIEPVRDPAGEPAEVSEAPGTGLDQPSETLDESSEALDESCLALEEPVDHGFFDELMDADPTPRGGLKRMPGSGDLDRRSETHSLELAKPDRPSDPDDLDERRRRRPFDLR